jgi:hypothetical protein
VLPRFWWGAIFPVQAEDALRAGRDDLAHEALVRCGVRRNGAESLATEHDQIADEERKFDAAAQLLEVIVKLRPARKEYLKASYSLSGDKPEIEVALAGMRDDVGTSVVPWGAPKSYPRGWRPKLPYRRANGGWGPWRSLLLTEEIRAELDAARTVEDVRRDLDRMKRSIPPRSRCGEDRAG